MRRILFRWRGITVWSYPAMLYVGLVVGVFAGNAAAHASGLDPFRTFVASIILFIPALIGARLLFVASHWDIYRADLPRIWDRSDGGQAMYGGLPSALLVSVPLLAALRLPFGAFWDIGAITILTGMIFTRFGCLLNGCCAGRPSDKWFSVYLPNARGVWQKRVPTQYLEAAWATVLLVSAIGLWHSMPFRGGLLVFVTAGYCSGRLVLESMREHFHGARGFTIQHAISVCMIVSSIAVLTARWPR
jgi:prolipoprotein diacylglyceryltransferase